MTSIGLDRSQAVNRTYQALAAPTSRKLALLVGIDHYGDSPPLQGCSTDVELQQELLIHRFGFHPRDIVTLVGEKATREAIETTFIEHLIEQVKPGDVVIFHFSGYGSEVKIPNETADLGYTVVNGFVPSDGILPKKKSIGLNDVLEETLMLLGRSLATDKVTFVLDTSHYLPLKACPSNYRIRSFPLSLERGNVEELAFQEQLRRHLKQTSTIKKKANFPGTILTAAKSNQVATELNSDQFSAGVFTYALTQYLWQVTPASKITVALNHTAQEMIPQLGERQQPQRLKGSKSALFTYYLLPQTPIGAEGVIVKVEDEKNLEVILNGIPLNLINYYGVNSVFRVLTLANSQMTPTSAPQIQLRSRDGLRATARLISPLDPPPTLESGQFLQESIRVIPRTLGLTVALDQSLQRIERVDATSGFASIEIVAGVTNATEETADCVLGKIIQNRQQEGNKVITEERYGLFSSGGVLFPNTLGSPGEAIKSAVTRLVPHLEAQLALKLWELTVNEASSGLGVKVTLVRVDKPPRKLWQKETRRLGKQVTNEPLAEQSEGILCLQRGTRLHYQVENNGDRPVYCLMVGITPTGQMIVISQGEDEEDISTFVPLEPGKTAVIPAPNAPFDASLSGTTGFVQLFTIFTPVPLEKTWQAITAQDDFQERKPQFLRLQQPLAVANAFLEELDQISDVSETLMNGSSDTYNFDLNHWATLKFIYRVV